MARQGTITDLVGVVDPGANTLDNLFRAAIQKNAVPTGSYVEYLAGTDGVRTMIGPPVPYFPGDVISLVPISNAASGTLTAPRFTIGAEDAN